LVLVKEISSKAGGTYVNNVYSIGESQLLRLRKPAGEDVWVIVSPRYGAWVSEKVSERAETTPFTSYLRGELARSKLERVLQLDLDRVFDFSLAGPESTTHMLLELMPPGNVLVTDSSGRITLALREFRSADRRIVKGHNYSPPPQRRLSPGVVAAADVARMLASAKTVGQAIGRNLALPRKYVREALVRLKVDETDTTASVEGRTEEIASVLQSIVGEAVANPFPCICETPEGPEIFAIRPSGLSITEKADSISSICDEVLLPRILEDIKEIPASTRTRKGELESTLVSLQKREVELLSEAQQFRVLAKQAGGAPTVEEARRIAKSASGRLPARKEAEASSPATISSLLYDAAKESERKSAEAHNAGVTISKRLARERPSVARTTTNLARRRLEWYEKFRWFTTSGGKLAIGGRDAQSNSLLIRRHVDNGDVVYHADLFGSPFFVLKEGEEQTTEEVTQLAQATVSYSSAWKTGLSAADAYWVEPQQVSAGAPTGEYLARGSFAIRGKKNFVTRNLLELAVGIDKTGRLVAGPEAALAKTVPAYVVIIPSREKSSDTAKKVLAELKELFGSSAGAVTLDDVMRALPTGGGKIVRRGKNKEDDSLTSTGEKHDEGGAPT
jgi:predicted ribosome quality control (RQC) complex YloA/Tae2 family protein